MNWDSGAFRDLDVDAMLQAVAASAARAEFCCEDHENCAHDDDDDGPESAEDVEEGAHFIIPLLIPEGMESGDGRKMAKEALTTRDLPIPLLWQPSTGTGHDGSYIVGRIDYIERVPNGLGNAQGVFDTGPYGREAERLVRNQMLRGISADLDQFEATVDGEAVQDMSKITNDKMVVDKARVMAATLVAKPAFQECTISIVDNPVEEMLEQIFGGGDDDASPMTSPSPLADGVYDSNIDDADFALSAIMASAAPTNPPASWFGNPSLDKATPLTIDDDGRVYGHIATWETDHIGYNYGVKPPRSRSNYAYFRTGLVRTEDGNDVAVGQLTLAGGHAPLDADARRAVQHYDDTQSAVADVAAGEDAFGIWVAGGLRPGVTPEQVRSLRASAPSGDWRPVNGTLELVAVCQVNVPGFPIARARVASGHVMALVAAGAQTLHKLRHSHVEDLEARLSALESRILEEKRAQLAARMAPVKEDRVRRLHEAAAQARARLAPELNRRAELAAQRDEVRARFKEFMLGVKPDFKDDLHPRDDNGKFRQVLAKLDEVLKMEADFHAPDADKAKDALSRAADAEDTGDHVTAAKAAQEAAGHLDSAAKTAEAVPTPAGDPSPVVGRLRGVAEDLNKAVSDSAAPVAPGDAPSPDAPDVPDAAPDVVPDAVPGPDGKVAPDAPTVAPTTSPSDIKVDFGRSDIPQPILDLIDTLVDEFAENYDPQAIYGRMDNQLKHWLEGKGFESPEDMAKVVFKMGARPIQPDIGQ